MSLTESVPMDLDRRNYQRAPLDPALRRYSAGTDFAANILDVSEGGARLAVADPSGFDGPMELWVPIRDREGQLTTCHVEGEVVRRDDNEVGVKFNRLLPLHFLQLRDYVWRARQTNSSTNTTTARPGGGSRVKQLFNRIF